MKNLINKVIKESRLFPEKKDDEIGELLLLNLKNLKPTVSIHRFNDTWIFYFWVDTNRVQITVESNHKHNVTINNEELDLSRALKIKLRKEAYTLYENQYMKIRDKNMEGVKNSLIQNSMSQEQLDQFSEDAFGELEESYYGLNDKKSPINENEVDFGSENILLKGHKDYRGKVFVHRNLNKPPYWTIKARHGEDAGLVIGYDKTIHLTNVIFSVGEKSRQRVLASGQKNVHAGVIGNIDMTIPDTKGWIPVTYNPYKNRTFVRVDNGEPIFKAKEVVLKNEKEVWAKL